MTRFFNSVSRRNSKSRPSFAAASSRKAALELLESRELLSASNPCDVDANLRGVIASEFAIEEALVGYENDVESETIDFGDAFEEFDETARPNATTIVVTTASDVVDASDGLISLREAIQYATDGDTITFDATLNGGTITLNGSQLEITKSITIDASALWNEETQTPGITIDGNQESRVLYAENADVACKGLALVNGNSDSIGGGVIVVNGNGTFTNCAISGNTASRYGGGVCIWGGGIGNFTDCVINENFADEGGGVYVYNTGTFTNCVINGNFADVNHNGYGYGGGAYVLGNGTFINCSICDNYSNNYGGGVYVYLGSAVFSNCTVGGNSAFLGEGAYIYGNNSVASFYNSIISSNSRDDVRLYDSGTVKGYNTLSSFADWSNQNEAGVFNYVYDQNQPLFADAPNGDYSLAANSQAIGKGNNAYVQTDLDRAGNRRIDGQTIDLGAYEYQTSEPWIVTTASDVVNPYDAKISLREAIQYASEGDTITFDAALQGTTITLNGSQLEITKPLTIDASDLWDELTQTPGITIDGNQASRVLYVSGDNVEFVGLAIVNGKSSDNGGGAYIFTGNASFTNCVICGNTALAGGGVYVYRGGKGSFIGCSINENVASDGGGVYIDGYETSVGIGTFTNCKIGGNTASSGGGGICFRSGAGNFVGCTITDNAAYLGGGARVCNGGSATFTDCSISENDAYDGGGAHVAGRGTFTNCSITENTSSIDGGGVEIAGTGSFTNCVISANAALRDGGGAYVYYGDGNFANCVISGNAASRDGGAVYQNGGVFSLVNSLVCENSADLSFGYGGAIRQSGGETRVYNSTIALNKAPVYGGVFSTDGLVILSNTIVAKNGGVRNIDLDSVNLNATANLIGSMHPWKSINGIAGNMIGTVDNPIDPLFVDSEHGDFTLAPNSQAIDKGDVAYVQTDFDLSGNARIANGTIDLGAYEYNSTSRNVVTTADDVVDAYDGKISLREAIQNANSGDTITFDAALQGATITLNGSQLEITKSLTIDASELCNESTQTPGITIDANERSRAFYIAGAGNDALEVAISRLYIRNGADEDGGGIYAVNAALTLVETNIVECSASYRGGAVYVSGGSVTVENGVVSNNRVTSSSSEVYGGAFYIASGAYLTIKESDITDNSASSSYYASGGAICNYGGTATITDSKISGNSATDSGGAICNNYGGTTTITDSEISGNSAAVGGAIYNSDIRTWSITGSEITITDSEISGNSANHGGAILNSSSGTATITASEISGNYADWGGAIYNSGTTTITDSEISGNSAARGGAIDNSGTTTITGSEISGNTATIDGGAIENSGTTTITGSEISGNTATIDGGAIENSGTTTITGSEIFGNSANYSGGAFYTSSGVVSLYSCTITANTANGGGGFYVGGSSNKTTFYNTIVAGNLLNSGASSDIYKYNSTAVITAYNTLSSYSAWDEGDENLVYNSSIPLFTNSDNGDYTLAPKSQAIDKGNNAYVQTDLDLSENVRIANGTVDLGAYEYNSTSRNVVTTAEDVVDPTDGKISLREAIQYAKNGDEIRFDASLRNATITLDGAPLEIKRKSLAIIAEYHGPRSLFPSGRALNICIDANNQSRIFELSGVFGTPEVSSVVLRGLRLANGSGGIQAASDVELTLSNCVIENCAGYGVYLNYSDATMINCRVSGCSGSGIYVGGGGNVDVYSCSIAQNNGTGILINAFRNATVSLYNSIVVGDTTNASTSYWLSVEKRGSAQICARNTLSSYTSWDESDSCYVYDPAQPLFADAANGDFNLARYSQALDKGNNAYVHTDFDLAENRRIDGEKVDIGAFEYRASAPWIVTTADDGVDEYDGKISLREAIQYAREGDTITFDATLQGVTITLNGSQLEITKSLTIDASALWNEETQSPGITIDADQKSRVFLIVTGDVMCDGLAIINGKTTEDGGGVRIVGGSGMFSNCVFAENFGYMGGGVIVGNNRNWTFINCAFIGNTASYGGGAVVGNYSGGTFTNCAFNDNAASSYGGGICVADNGVGSLTLCLISGNTAHNGGGTYIATTADATFENCAITNNSSTTGGAVYVYKGSGTFVNCALSGNAASSNGGGAYVYGNGNASFYNSIVAQNNSNDVDFYNGVVNGYNTLSSFSDWTNRSESGVVNYLYDPSKPLFTDPENGDFTLAPNSQAIDKGNNAYIQTDVDLAGNARIANGTVDLGAYEYQGIMQLAAPTLTWSARTSSTITVNWETISNAKSYTISYAVKSNSPNYKTATLGASKTSYMLRDLEVDAEYVIRIRANGDGVEYSTSEYSETIAVKTYKVHQPLDAPALTATATASTITLNWNAVDNASGYAIDFNGTTYALGASETSYTITGLAYSTSYRFVARALGDGDAFVDSDDAVATFSTTALVQLPRPTLTSTATSATTIGVSWEAIPNASSYTVSYAVKSSSPEYATVYLGANATNYTIRNLQSSTSYYVKIRANGDGVEYKNSAQSPTITVKTNSNVVTLATPSITATRSTASTITVDWNPVDGASGYELLCGDQTTIVANDVSTHVFTSLAANANYAIKIKALGNGTTTLDSAYSDALSIGTTALVQLARPTLTATATSATTIAASWETIPNASSYTISYAVKSSSPDYKTATLGASKTSYTLRDLAPNTNYYVKIRANGDNVEYKNSAQSPTVTVKTPRDVVTLDAPVVTATSATAATITVQWNAVSGAAGYELVCGSQSATVEGDATSYTFTGLTANTSYTIKAKALGNGTTTLDSPYSDVATKSTTALVQLARPALTATGTSSNSIAVAWETIPNASSYTISYAVKSSTPEYATVIAGATATSYTLRNLQSSTSYYLKIRANGDDVEYKNSAQSPTITVKTTANVVALAAPTIIATSATAATITVNWSPVSGAAGYELVCGSQSATVAGDATSYTFTGLTANTSYTIKAKTLGNGTTTLDSPYSDVATKSTTALVQLARPALTATATTTDSIAVAWETIPGASSYTISYAVKASSPVYKTATLGATKTSYTIRNLESGTSYYLKIRANGDNVEYKNSAQSPTITAKTASDVVTLAAPTITATSATAATITVNWSPVSGAAGYELLCGSQSATVASDATSYTFTGLTANTSYSIKAKALGNGTTTLDSPYSDVATKSTTAIQQLARPALTATATTTDSIAVAWETIHGASSYTISYAVKASSPVYKTATLGATKTSYTIRGLESGTSYYLKIRANGDNVEYRDSAQSPTITAKTTVDVVALATPEITATSATASTIALSWTPVSNASSYAIVCGGRTIVGVSANASSYTITGLTANTNYDVKMKAVGNGSTTIDSPYSEPIAIQTAALVQLARPTLVVDATTATGVGVSWAPVANARSYTLSYAVKASSPVYTTITLDANATSCMIEGLDSNTSYYIKIRANGDAVEYANSPQSATQTARTLAANSLALLDESIFDEEFEGFEETLAANWLDF